MNVPIHVKQEVKVGRPDIDSFEAVIARDERQRWFFVSFGFTSEAEQECAAFHNKKGYDYYAHRRHGKSSTSTTCGRCNDRKKLIAKRSEEKAA